MNPFLRSFRGRGFNRINPNAVETFTLSECEQCKAAVALNHITLSEPKDDVLFEHGLNKLSPPQTGVSVGAHGPIYCQSCYKNWLDPSSASREDQLEVV